jgi:omega-6 fatty acid desaturase (delta-12 desaturase)
VVLFGLAPIYLLLIHQRFAASQASSRERWSVRWMNLSVFGMAVALSWLFGFTTYLLIQLTIAIVGGGLGIWLFYVQHQFEGVYWEREGDWDFTAAALQGSSFYKLPRIMQWFSGNIGFHHIHHLSARIPNYNLERCHKANPLFQEVKAITFFTSLKSLTLRLWDERQGKLISFRQLRELRAE